MNRGISTIELLIAFTVMAMAVSGAAGIGLSVPGIIADARSASAALDRAVEAVWHPDGSVSEEALEDESFIRRTSIQQWPSSNGGSRIVQLSTVLDVGNGPKACDPFTSGDWSRPILVQSFAVDGLGLPAGAYTVSALAMSPGMLAVSIASTSEASQPTLLLFSLAGTSTPLLSAAFDNASGSRIGNGSLAVHGAYAFVGNAFSSSSTSTCSDAISCAQVSVYARNSSFVISSLSLAKDSAPFAYRADGGSAPVSALTYYNGYVYAGLEKTVAGDEFNIIDAHDPAHLRWISGFRVGRTVNSITVRDGYAYVSTDDPSRELLVLDVHDSALPLLQSSWDAPGSSTFGYGSASTVFGSFVRLGRTYTAGAPEFELLQRGNDSITELDSLDIGTAQDPESVRALFTQDRLTFMLLTHRLDILDTHDSVHTRLEGTFALPGGSTGAALACRNNQLYLARNGTGGRGYVDILQGS